MTHTGPMHESDGTFEPATREGRYCHGCKRNTPHKAEQWNSNDGAFEDMKYTCTVCSKVHWVDGIDS